MTIIEFFITWVVLSIVYALGYITRRAFEPPERPTFKRIVSGPILHGNFTGRYVVEEENGSIHYVFPPVTLTLK